ncbi:hypothetical protein ASE75_13480 [Sphingomonas sp. Leaf17]|uniref:hypothetical protein n=1 Tax=Sphingomonas sp. Leaf17 TaxID=1735683 RepID=UPI00070008B8|nr:hypothetical protein [Sphingomonas sp. Leaf17]KQM63445.1 hypothetical protein ASE75_13480 [Sphingomonas sp. Leaf17]
MQRTSAAGRRYIRRFLPAMAGYVVILFATTWAIKAWHPTGAALFALSALPALPLIAVIAVMGLYLLEERDEFIRYRLVTAMLVGLGGLLVITTTWGFLEFSGAVVHFPTFLAFPLWCMMFGLAQCGMALRDRMQDTQSGDRTA